MSIEYTVEITRTRVKNEGTLADVVREVDFTLTGTDRGCSFQLPVTLKFDAPDSENFIPFEDLSKAEVENWIWSKEDDIQAYKAHIAIVVARETSKLGLEQKPLPWEPIAAINTAT